MAGLFTACCRPAGRFVVPNREFPVDEQDALLWYKDITVNGSGSSPRPSGAGRSSTTAPATITTATSDLSLAVVQANEMLEDQSQVKTGPFGTLVGVYDGHGGAEASRFITSHLFPKIEGFAKESGCMSSKVLKKAFSATEEEFLGLVDENWRSMPQIASVGSCCLVGVISANNIHIANLGDSRVVLGTSKQGSVVAVRLSEEHNAGNAEVREELRAEHPDDSHIVVLKQGVWRVRGIIQVSRSIGDVYLKNPEVARDPQFSHHVLLAPLKKAVLSAEPSVVERTLSPSDRFLIFASDGLWEQLTDQQAVDLVSRSSRHSIARRLVRAALQQAAKKREMRYSDLQKLEPGIRRYFHDDITVVVVYLDMQSPSSSLASPLFRGSTRASRVISMDSSYINAPLDISSAEYSLDTLSPLAS